MNVAPVRQKNVGEPHLLSIGNLLDCLAADEVVIDVLLHVGHLAAHDLD